MAFLHTAIDSNGDAHKRRSQHHRYPFAIVAHWPARQSQIDPNVTWPAHASATWSSKRHFAEQYAADRLRNGATAAEIIEAVIEERRS